MRDNKNRKSNRNRKRLSAILGRFGWYLLSAIDRKRKFRFPSNLHSDDWRSWTYQLNIDFAWAGYRIGITIASAAAFGIGVGQLYLKMNGIN